MRSDSKRVALLHAYSRHNLGDGLLVDLTIQRLDQVGVSSDELVVLALDAGSFSDLADVRQVGTPTRRPRFGAVSDLAMTAVGFGLQRRLRNVGAFVGVGGGYLRASDLVSTLGVYVNHAAQLMVSSRAEVPSIYMPVSVGPLRGWAGRRLARLFSGVDLVCARDDVTVREIGPYTRVERVPDLAVLAIAGGEIRLQTNGKKVAIVARDLPDGRDYLNRLKILSLMLPDATWAVQVGGGGSKSDATFYEELGVREAVPLDVALSTGEFGVVISVRLHGALAAISAGVPSIHLSYGRKGLGAFGDLGMADLVHEAHSFDPSAVVDQAKRLVRDASPVWDRLASRRFALDQASDRLNEMLAATLERRRARE